MTDWMSLTIPGRNFTNARGDCYPIVTHPYKFSKGFGWVGISHCTVFQQEGTGDWFYASQARLPDTAGGNAPNAVMMGHVRRIMWCPASSDDLTDLWPIALPERYAGLSDKSPVTAEEIAGTWEHINLKYAASRMSLQTLCSRLTALCPVQCPVLGPSMLESSTLRLRPLPRPWWSLSPARPTGRPRRVLPPSYTLVPRSPSMPPGGESVSPTRLST